MNNDMKLIRIGYAILVMSAINFALFTYNAYLNYQAAKPARRYLEYIEVSKLRSAYEYHKAMDERRYGTNNPIMP